MAFEDFVNFELPRRGVTLVPSMVGGYDGDPNDGGAPDVLKYSPAGAEYYETTARRFWRKMSAAAGDWEVAGGGGGGGETVAEVDLYIRAVDGDDGDPGSDTEPLATLTEAESRLPFIINHTVRLHVGPHVGSGYDMVSFRQRVLNANIWVIGDGGGGVTDGFTEIVSSTAALAGSDNTKVVSSGLSDTEFGGLGEHFGRTIEILSGAAAGDRRTIKDNTATDIIVTIPFSAAVTTGDLYRIVEPETVLYVTHPSDTVATLNSSSTNAGWKPKTNDKKLSFVNLKVDSDIVNTKFPIMNSVLGFFGVDFVRGAFFVSGHSTIFSGIERDDYPYPLVTSPVADLGVGSDSEWAGWGMVSRSVEGGSLMDFDSLQFFGVISGPNVNLEYLCSFFMIGGSCWGSYAVAAGSNTYAVVYGEYSTTILGSVGGSGPAVLANQGAQIFLAGISATEALVLRNANGIRALNQSMVQVGSYGVDAIQFNNTGIGMKVEWNSVIEVDGDLLMSCAGGDFSEDNGETTNDISELVSGALFANVAHGVIRR